MKWIFGKHETKILIGRQEEPQKSGSYDNEVDILNHFVDSYLSEYKDKLKVVSNTDDYTTLQYDEMDLMKLKYSDNAKWITIFVAPKIKKDYIDNELFITQKNKNQLHWKSFIKSDADLTKYVEICLKDLEFWKNMQ